MLVLSYSGTWINEFSKLLLLKEEVNQALVNGNDIKKGGRFPQFYQCFHWKWISDRKDSSSLPI